MGGGEGIYHRGTSVMAGQGERFVKHGRLLVGKAATAAAFMATQSRGQGGPASQRGRSAAEDGGSPALLVRDAKACGRGPRGASAAGWTVPAEKSWAAGVAG